ncbi:MAG TPA: DnaJ family domain-containing protein, partial [Acidimicrobiales bacterium]|nr:DnaJ family domain-containing protein [Acidimicrobiales bacterium]
MTQRKPPGVTWETWIDRQIRVGMESGAFDDLPGAGTPLRDLDRTRDEMWWVREKVRREKVVHVPVTVQVRRELDAALAAIAEAPSEDAVREIVATINARVRWVNSRPVTGPPSTVAPLDAEAEVRAWRARR